jgi:carboxyl-terminal processing protease
VTALIFTALMVTRYFRIPGIMILAALCDRPLNVPRLSRHLSKLTAFVLLVSTVGCSAVGGAGSGGGNAIVTPAPAPRGTPTTTAPVDVSTTPTPATAARLRGEGLSSADLYVGYRALLDRYVDQIDSTQLIRAASDSLKTSLRDQTELPMMTLPLQLLPQPTGNADKDWQAFGDAYDALVAKMPAWAEQTHPDWLVMRAMTTSLNDGHTIFFTPDEARRAQETSFVGIGVVLSRPQSDQPPLIAEIFPNSPAAGSGLKRGDRIVAVDGNDVTGKSVGDIASAIRGPRGTDVKVTVRRLSSPQPIDITMRRAQVQVEQVVVGQAPTAPIGYIRIRGFTDDSVAQTVLGVLQQGPQHGLRAWVLDLRGNAGGSLRAVLEVAAGFVDPDHTVIGYQVDRQRQHNPLETQAANLTSGMTVVVLVDHDTASGAEILAAALQEAKLAQLVGTKTAGNVGVATQIPMPDDSQLQITEQRFESPSGVQLDGVGVTPDIQVDMTDEDLENDRDPQLAKAVGVALQAVLGGTRGG